jgi:glutathione S-transferase
MSTESVQLFVLGTGWGVPFPTSAPFPLKLATWMRMLGVDFEWVVENDPGKGPKGKSPWIEHGATRMGDSTLIIEYLRSTFSLPDLDAALSAEQLALSNVVQRMLEEHYHQCFEHQLFFGRGGQDRLDEFGRSFPPVLSFIVPRVMKRAFVKQLHARGMGRHPEEVIIAQGCEDLDSLSALLGDKLYFHGDAPSEIDACIFGFLGVSVYVEGDNPLYRHGSSNSNLMAYCERMRERYFPETLKDLPLLESFPAGKSDRRAA